MIYLRFDVLNLFCIMRCLNPRRSVLDSIANPSHAAARAMRKYWEAKGRFL
jgi:hypothetical protein